MSQITVIVPVYKVELYIDRCLESILGQSFSDFDLVLIDDGSPDSCPQICDAYAEKDERITVIHKQNGGLSDARNAGIDWAMEHSDSEWLAFVDSDDYLHPDYLKILYDTAKKEEADLVICDFVRVNDQDENVEKKHSFFSLVTEDKNELFQCLNKSWRVAVAWNKLYGKHIFAQLRFKVGKIHEDAFAIHHVLWNSHRVAFINDGLYFYRTRENSIMASQSPKSRLDNIEALIEQYEFCKQHHVVSPSLLHSDAFLNRITNLRHVIDDQELCRYKDIKRRYRDIFFDINTNRKLKRILRFYLNRPLRALVRFFKQFFGERKEKS